MKKIYLLILITSVLMVSCSKEKVFMCSNLTVVQDGVTYFLTKDLDIKDKYITGNIILLDKKNRVIGTKDMGFFPLPYLTISDIPTTCFVVK